MGIRELFRIKQAEPFDNLPSDHLPNRFLHNLQPFFLYNTYSKKKEKKKKEKKEAQINRIRLFIHGYKGANLCHMKQ